jgi:hypothetical protein
MNDITTVEENSAAADFLMNTVWELVNGLRETRLVASLAGGRKTMGALLFACMSLLARPEDLLTHVLVNEPFDKPGLRPRFYFPLEKPVVHRVLGPEGKTTEVPSDQAAIRLAPVEFVALRNLFERDLLQKRTYSDLVALCRGKIQDFARENVQLVIWRSRCEIRINRAGVKLSPKQHLFLTVLAEQAANRGCPFQKYAVAALALRKAANDLYAQRNGEDFSDWRHDLRLDSDTSGDDQLFRKLRDEIITKLKKTGGDAVSLIALLPNRNRCSLDLPQASIRFED